MILVGLGELAIVCAGMLRETSTVLAREHRNGLTSELGTHGTGRRV